MPMLFRRANRLHAATVKELRPAAMTFVAEDGYLFLWFEEGGGRPRVGYKVDSADLVGALVDALTPLNTSTSVIRMLLSINHQSHAYTSPEDARSDTMWFRQ
jgi:hypothetical protein